METMGQSASSATCRHSSTESFLWNSGAYSRMRPQPTHSRLQSSNGSSIRVKGNFSVRSSFFFIRYLATVRFKLIGLDMNALSSPGWTVFQFWVYQHTGWRYVKQ